MEMNKCSLKKKAGCLLHDGAKFQMVQNQKILNVFLKNPLGAVKYKDSNWEVPDHRITIMVMVMVMGGVF